MVKAAVYVRAAWFCLFVFVLYFLYRMNFVLPDRFAVHFDALGRPNGWGHKPEFVTFFSLLIVGTNALIYGLYQFRHLVKFSLYRFYSEPANGTKEQIREEVINKSSLILAVTGVFLNYTYIVCVQIIGQAAIEMPIKIPANLLLISIFALTFVMLIFSLLIARPSRKN